MCAASRSNESLGARSSENDIVARSHPGHGKARRSPSPSRSKQGLKAPCSAGPARIGHHARSQLAASNITAATPSYLFRADKTAKLTSRGSTHTVRRSQVTSRRGDAHRVRFLRRESDAGAVGHPTHTHTSAPNATWEMANQSNSAETLRSICVFGHKQNPKTQVEITRL